jgi:AcrR family transcriptional regulator
MARQPAAGVRAHILDTAAGLFDTHGIRAVGMQQIIDTYGCGKNLLYREFPSKDELVVAYLERCRQDSIKTVEKAIEPLAGDPGGQLVAIIRANAEKASCSGARGCPLRSTYAEFPDPDHPAHRVAAEHFADLRAQLQEIAEQTAATDPTALANRIMLILDGAHTNAATFGPAGATSAAVDFAEEVVASALRA